MNDYNEKHTFNRAPKVTDQRQPTRFLWIIFPHLVHWKYHYCGNSSRAPDKVVVYKKSILWFMTI